jgi:D-glycero-D-manno-heptose 1,7-bisphosphate phosphatase
VRKVVFFDRDGTLIFDKIYLNDPDQIEYLPGVFPGLRQLRDHGFEFIVVTNQSGVPRGLVDIENLHEIHRRIRVDMAREGIDILQFYYAPFLVESNHPMRKPNPGMITSGISEFNVDPQPSWMVGDRYTDVVAGHRAGLRNVFLCGTETPPESNLDILPDYVAPDFDHVCQYIVTQP